MWGTRFFVEKVVTVLFGPAPSGSFDCASRKSAGRFAQDDRFIIGDLN
jgi:hypothetical protein